MKAKVVQIGNSHGVRIPKVLLDQCGLKNNSDIDIEVEDGSLIIKPLHKARKGWDSSFREMAAQKDDSRIGSPDADDQTVWDNEEWEWK